jgi:hypothetical protein
MLIMLIIRMLELIMLSKFGKLLIGKMLKKDSYLLLGKNEKMGRRNVRVYLYDRNNIKIKLKL